MTENKSLAISLLLGRELQKDLSNIFEKEFPFGQFPKDSASRDRLYNRETTLLTMINSSALSDRSLKNSVLIYNKIHERNIARIEHAESELRNALASNPSKRIRKTLDIQKSKRKPISTKTGGYSQARTRLSSEYVKQVYRKSAESASPSSKEYFYGRQVFITDGTYVQLQDSAAIAEKFNKSLKDGYPRGLISAVIEQGSGLVADFTMDSDKKSELELFGTMINNLPTGSLLLADALYDCFAIYGLLIERNVDLIVPDKRGRKYHVLKTIAEGDEIVKITIASNKSKIYNKFNIKTESLRLRRIEVASPNDNKTIVLFTTILDESIGKMAMYLKYFTRWDIEISIREIKQIMNLNILRGQSPDMALKELTAGLIAYNYIRTIITRTVAKTDFPPEVDLIYELYKNNKIGYVDKLGREYSKHSPGRYGRARERDTKEHHRYASQ